jgi:hypothetical protein
MVIFLILNITLLTMILVWGFLHPGEVDCCVEVSEEITAFIFRVEVREYRK